MRVALRKESVDRNCDLEPIKNPEAVALRKESVDRNGHYEYITAAEPQSLSARRAWIEIVYPGTWSGSILGRSPQGERG